MSKLYYFIIFVLGLSLWSCQTKQPAVEIPPPPYRLIAYASDWMPKSSAKMLTHVNFSFGNIKAGEVFIEAEDSLRLSRIDRKSVV